MSLVENGDQSVGEGEASEPPDDVIIKMEMEFPTDFPSELKCPVLLFKPKLPGHSHIYSALDNLTQHRVAIKRIKIDKNVNDEKILSTIRELRVLRGLEHESIVKFLDCKLTPSNVYIVQELMDTDLECILDNTSLELDHIRLFSFQLLRAVNFIHSAHIIHRDIQMSNVFINVDTLMLKIGDFGSSRVLDNRQQNRLLSLPGDIRWYHAPEIVLGERDYDFTVDIFSIGVIFYAMCHGTSYDIGHTSADFIKFWSDRICSMPSSGDEDFDNIIKSCLQIQSINRGSISDLLKSSFYEMIFDGNSERISRTQFHIEDEIFNMDSIYDELISSIKSCRPDDEVANGMKQNSSIRSFVDVCSTCELSTISEPYLSEHEARILQTDYDFGIIINDCSDKKDRMIYEDHHAELGVSFDPYKWDRKLTNSIKDHEGYQSSGYQSGDIKTDGSFPNTQSSSPDNFSSDHETPPSTDFHTEITEREIELDEEATRHHFDRCHVHPAAHSFYNSHKHHHHGKSKHKHSKKHSKHIGT